MKHRSRFTDEEFDGLPRLGFDFDLIGATVAALRARGMDVQPGEVAAVLELAREVVADLLRRHWAVNLGGITLRPDGTATIRR